MTEVESVVKPDGIGNDAGSESVSLIGIHPAILAISETLLGNTLRRLRADIAVDNAPGGYLPSV